jgi:hypothetical protein
MKVYYFTVIAIGIMFTLGLAGIDTNSSQILNFISGNNLELWHNSAFIIYLGAFFVSVIAIGIITGSVSSPIAGFMSAIYVIFFADLISIVRYIGTLTCTNIIPATNTCAGLYYHTFEYWVAWGLIVPLLIGYLIAVVEFIRGGD